MSFIFKLSFETVFLVTLEIRPGLQTMWGSAHEITVNNAT